MKTNKSVLTMLVSAVILSLPLTACGSTSESSVTNSKSSADFAVETTTPNANIEETTQPQTEIVTTTVMTSTEAVETADITSEPETDSPEVSHSKPVNVNGRRPERDVTVSTTSSDLSFFAIDNSDYILGSDYLSTYDEFMNLVEVTPIEGTDSTYTGIFEENQFYGKGFYTGSDMSTKIYLETDDNDMITAIVFDDLSLDEGVITIGYRDGIQPCKFYTELYINDLRNIFGNRDEYIPNIRAIEYNDGSYSAVFAEDHRSGIITSIMLYRNDREISQE